MIQSIHKLKDRGITRVDIRHNPQGGVPAAEWVAYDGTDLSHVRWLASCERLKALQENNVWEVTGYRGDLRVKPTGAGSTLTAAMLVLLKETEGAGQ